MFLGCSTGRLHKPFHKAVLLVPGKVGVHTALAGHPTSKSVESVHDALQHQQREDHPQRHAAGGARLVAVVEERPDVRLALGVGAAARPVDHREEVEEEIEADRVDEMPEAHGRGGDEEFGEAEKHGDGVNFDLVDELGVTRGHVECRPVDDGNQDRHGDSGVEEEPLDLVTQGRFCKKKNIYI